MVTFRIRVPAFTPAAVSNVLGLLGLAGIVFALGALTDWRWATLAGSIICVGLAYVAHLNVQPQSDAQPEVRPDNVRRHPAAEIA